MVEPGPAAIPPRSRAKQLYHLALAGIFIPVLLLPFVWIVALYQWLRPHPDPSHRVWARRLMGLALADLVVTAAVIWYADRFYAHDAPEDIAMTRRPDGEAGLIWLAPPLLVVLVSWAWARRCAELSVRIWRAVIPTLVISVVAGAAAARIAARVIETPMAPALVGILVQTSMLLLLTLLFRRFLRGDDPGLPPQPPVLSPLAAILRGAFYFITGMTRIGVVLVALDTLVLGGRGMGRNPVGINVSGTLEPVVALLLVAAAVIVGPIGEEHLFRGLLLPRLAAQLGLRGGLWVSAILFALLHPQYGIYMVMVLYHGLILGWARLRTGGLAAPIALHMLINALATVRFLLS